MHGEVVYQQRFAVENDGTRIAGYDVVTCVPCGAVYADGIPSQAAIDAYYRESSKYEYLETAGEQPDWQLRWHNDVVDSLVSFLPDTNAHIVDIGCANGDLLGMLADRGYRHVLGVDPAPGSSEAAERLHGVRVIAGDVLALPPEAQGADCVILSAVLEHLRDVREALRVVTAALAAKGVVYVEVPDLGDFASTVVPPFQQFSVEHINYFTAGSLLNAAAFAGLESVRHWSAARHVGPAVEPSLCAVFQRQAGQLREFKRDAEGPLAVRDYIAVSSALEREVDLRIRALVGDGVPVILWGVGTHALHLLGTTSLREANIVALVDANPRLHGVRAAGRVVASPESVAARTEALLICSPLRQDEIVRMARERYAMSNEIITLYDTGA